MCGSLIMKQTLQLKKSISKIFAGNKHFLQCYSFLFSLIVELKENKTRLFWKELYNSIFHNVVKYERMKSSLIFKLNDTILFCLFHIIETVIFLSSIQVSYLTDHQIQMLKKNAKGFPIYSFLVAMYLSLDILTLTFCPFTPNMEKSKVSFTHIGQVIFSLQHKNKQ